MAIVRNKDLGSMMTYIYIYIYMRRCWKVLGPERWDLLFFKILIFFEELQKLVLNWNNIIQYIFSMALDQTELLSIIPALNLAYIYIYIYISVWVVKTQKEIRILKKTEKNLSRKCNNLIMTFNVLKTLF